MTTELFTRRTEHAPAKPLLTLFLDRREDLEACVYTLTSDKPIVLNGGAMYGTVFLPRIRANIAEARGETQPWDTVSVLTTFRSMSETGMLDLDRIHPDIRSSVEAGNLGKLTSLVFIRLPVKPENIGPELRQHCVNGEREIQVFLMPQKYPLLEKLHQQGINALLVRSANLHNQPPALDYSAAVEYARCLGRAPIAVPDSYYLSREKRRSRIGGNNIVRFGPDPVVELLRTENTGVDTTRRLLAACGLLPEGTSLLHCQAKARPSSSPAYECPSHLVSYSELAGNMLTASGLPIVYD